jgi:hypothetical protein
VNEVGWAGEAEFGDTVVAVVDPDAALAAGVAVAVIDRRRMKGVGEASGDGTQSSDRLAFGHRQDRRLVGGAGVVVDQAAAASAITAACARLIRPLVSASSVAGKRHERRGLIHPRLDRAIGLPCRRADLGGDRPDRDVVRSIGSAQAALRRASACSCAACSSTASSACSDAMRRRRSTRPRRCRRRARAPRVRGGLGGGHDLILPRTSDIRAV